MDRDLREAVVERIAAGKRKRVETRSLLAAIRQKVSGPYSDFEIQDRLLSILRDLEKEERLRLPATPRGWDRQTGLPHFVTAMRPEADEARHRRKTTLDALRHQTAWEPTRMAAFAHTLKDIAELEKARQVNRYLLARKPGTARIPHRERALMVFGDEKALDRYTRRGLFAGRIVLSDLDCFYCPEPLPFRPFSLDPRETEGKPLLVVENANTYWSCCQANAGVKCYAAVVYGQGSNASAAERACDGLLDIETQVASAGIFYFGDLDPTGIAIAARINGYRQEKGLTPLGAERRLYRALLEKDLCVPFKKSQVKDHDPELARHWLGEVLADVYLKRAHAVRWPQEGLVVEDIVGALS